jgi:phthiocerol/phenolphthiocerol synthesis type-I polyketide synthase C
MKRPDSARHAAIIGMAFRLPGGVDHVLWPTLLEGRDLVTSVESSRWAKESHYHPRRSEPGSSYSFAAGSIGDVSGFDAAFFGISTREAAQMDPQQRVLLELAWEALENAAVPASALRGTNSSVYIGLSSVDYSYRLAYDMAAIDSSSATGGTASIAANRISYFLDLHGPSMVIDTACSSSLVAFHQACQSITSGESSHALVGGVSLHLHPYGFIAFSKASMLSRSGACRVFDAEGDGYVRSEGGGIFVLKELDHALKDGNPILAVVAGSGVNSGGRSSGLTVPSAEAQAALLSDVYSRAGIDPAEIDYLEAHGTGTVVGDPIEARALGMALGRLRSSQSPLLIGSVKSNLGHLEAASGVAGMVKALLCLKHRMIPPTIHLREPSPQIRFDEWNLKPVSEPTALHPFKKLVIGVNSFGFGGTNAHVILESTPGTPKAVDDVPGEVSLMISGNGDAALRASAQSYAALLRADDSPSLRDIAYSSIHLRDWHSHRAIVAGADRSNVAASLAAFAKGESAPDVASGTALAAATGPAFVYSGNGAVWAGMGAALMAEEPVFRDAIDHVDALFRRESDFSIGGELREGVSNERLRATEIAQPLLFALQVGITEMLRSQGIAPTAVAGHSVGEVAAAWACGALTLDEAVQVVFHRSRLQGITKGAGAMAAVGLGECEARELIASLELAGKIAVACLNSPRHVTVSGAREFLEVFEQALAAKRVFHRRLDLAYAFHSCAMDPIRDDLVAALRGLRPGPALVPFHSTVTGDAIPGTLLNASYWWKNVRNPVKFESAIRGVAASRASVFVEIGPQPILRNYIDDCLRAASAAGRALATMERHANNRVALRNARNRIVIAGVPIEIAKVFPEAGQRVELPAYPWQRERHWRSPTPSAYELADRPKVHPLLGSRLHENAHQWENHLDTALYPALADHVVGGTVVFPASGFIEMALAASAQIHGGDCHEIESLEIRSPLLLEESASKTVRFALDGPEGRFSIRSRPRASEDPWQLHVVGKLLGAPPAAAPIAKRSLPGRKADLTAAEHYQLAERVGLSYGPAFKAVARVWLDAGDAACAVARLRIPNVLRKDMGTAHLHPSSVDGAFQLLVDLLRNEIERDAGVAFVPVQMGRIRLYRSSGPVIACRARIVSRGPRSVVADFELSGSHGERIADLEGVRFRGVALKAAPGARLRHLAYRAVPKMHDTEREHAPLVALASFAELFAGRMHELARAPRERYYGEVEPLTDILCAAFAERAVRSVASNAPHIQAQALASAIPAERVPLLNRLLQILEEDQIFEPGEDGWRWTPVEELPDANESWITLLRDYPEESSQLVALGLAGMRLPDVLAGNDREADGGAAAASATAFASLATGCASYANAARALADTVAAWAQRMPPDRPLRILELTPCRSEITARILASVERDRCEYLVGCTTESALAEYDAVREGARSFEACRAALDAAGLGPDMAHRGRFDAIIVADGLLTSPRADAGLENLSGLLAHDGTLVMLAQRPSRWTDLLFGALASWWTHEGEAPQSRLRTPEEWERALVAHGYSSSISVPEIPGLDRGFYTLFARRDRSADRIERASPERAGAWIFVQGAAGYSCALGAALQAQLLNRGHRTFEIPGGSTSPAVDFDAGLAFARTALGTATGIVYLLALPDEPPGSTAPEKGIERLAEQCAGLSRLIEACRASHIAPEIWLVTSGATAGIAADPPGGTPRRAHASAENAVLWGFARSVANECPDFRIRRVDCADLENLESVVSGLLVELASDLPEDEIILTRSGRLVMRLGACDAVAAPHDPHLKSTRLDFSMPGTLRNLEWRGEPRRRPGPEEVEIEVRAAGLNFRDVMYAMGLLADEAVETGFAGATLGMELSGVVTSVGRLVKDLSAGDEVLAFAPGSFSTRAVTRAACVAKKPAGWSFEAAATVPTAYFTVLYALKHLAHLRDGESVLIHGAAGGVGIAAVQVAKWMGAKVFATAGSRDKRDFVRMLGADHVFDSRTLAFADEVLRITDGIGVDVVLNSLSGEAISRNLRVLRPFGRFLELGKRDFYENTAIGLRPFRNNISYFGIDADQILKERPELARELFAELMLLAGNGVVAPLPYRAFAAADAVEAFRYMQQSRHTGKIVLSFAEGVRPQARSIAAGRTLELAPDASYLVTGGLSGFGLKTAQWLVSKGARHLVLVSRTGPATLGAKAAVADLQALGATVEAVACDVTDREAMSRLIEKMSSAATPLRGVVHAAAVIDDGLARNASVAKIASVLAPKILGARHLDELTRGLKLDFFVLYSSATTLFGNPGQANYVAANCFLEALASERRREGLPATCISWGAIGDVGYLARNRAVKDALQSHMGGAPMDSSAALAVLEQSILANESGAGVLDFSWRSLRRFLPSAESPRFSELATRLDEDIVDGDRAQEMRTLAREMGAEEFSALLVEILRKEVAEILRIPPERLDPRQPLRDLGMDSLMGVELLTAVEEQFGVNLQVMAMSEGPSIEALVERIARSLRAGDEGDGDDPRAELQAHVDHVAAKYAGEIERAQVDELARSIVEEQRAEDRQ